MGYLNKSTTTVDAILTKKGRELLARGRSAFNISQFAVADDEIDYGLYDPSHPLGTEYYGSAIENMPIVEASPDETQNLRYKLVTLARGTNLIPIIQDSAGVTSITLTYSRTSNPSTDIKPTTSQGLNLAPFGYTAILYDGSAAVLTSDGTATTQLSTATVPIFIGDSINRVSNNAVVVRGTTKFTIAPKDVSQITYTQLVIVGNQTGATVTIPITIKPASQ
jgi:hypothetical protein